MNAHRGIIGQEATGQMDRQSQAQGETDMQTIIGKTQGRAAEGGHRRTRTPNKWRAAVFGLILSSGLTLGMAGTAQAALSVSITAPANNTVALAPASFTLTAIAGNPQGAPIQSVAFYANDGTTNTLLGTIAAPTGPGSITLPAQAAAKAPIGTAANTTYTWNWSSVPMGVYSVTAVVTDKSGGTATSTPVIVVADVPPTVGITRPADHSSAEPGDIPLAANATSPLGTVAKVAFYAATITNGTSGTPVLIGTATKGTGGTYTAIWLNAPLGKYTLTAIATDNWGITGPAGPITFTVTEPRPYYIHTDHLGTPRMITDTNGNVVWQWDNSDP
ncbi:MAG TPA: Ig-like domain-containing protein, partial [Thiobacillus sp.]|nr:Ig-like domain-containing protein [Thiobacillus sp.]